MYYRKRYKSPLYALSDYLLYRISLKKTTLFLEEKYESKITWKIIQINICFWATELEIGDSSSKAYPSSSHNSTRRILSNRARYKWLELESLPELESQPL